MTIDFFRKVLIYFLILLAGYYVLQYVFGPLVPEHIKICKDTSESGPQDCPTYKLIPAIVAYVEAHAAFITTLSTIAIAGFTGTLWFSTRRLSQITRDAFIADKRALVFASSVTAFHTFDPSTKTYSWRFRATLDNASDAPTKKMTMYVDCEVRNSALPKKYSFPDDANSFGFGSIPPRTKILGGMAPRGAGVTAQDIADAQAGKKFIYFWG